MLFAWSFIINPTSMSEASQALLAKLLAADVKVQKQKEADAVIERLLEPANKCSLNLY